MDQMSESQDISMDAGQLSREDVFTDNRVGTIRRLTPVDGDGNTDASRPVQYIGSTQILTPAGALLLTFEIEADSLEGAVEGFGDAAKVAVDRTMEELREMQRQAASQIVVPKGGMDPSGMGGMGGGGIQMP